MAPVFLHRKVKKWVGFGFFSLPSLSSRSRMFVQYVGLGTQAGRTVVINSPFPSLPAAQLFGGGRRIVVEFSEDSFVAGGEEGEFLGRQNCASRELLLRLLPYWTGLRFLFLKSGEGRDCVLPCMFVASPASSVFSSLSTACQICGNKKSVAAVTSRSVSSVFAAGGREACTERHCQELFLGAPPPGNTLLDMLLYQPPTRIPHMHAHIFPTLLLVLRVVPVEPDFLKVRRHHEVVLVVQRGGGGVRGRPPPPLEEAQLPQAEGDDD